MALQVRRGTNSERLAVTPVIGELIYVTDTKQLFIGDGTTVGGTTAVAGTIDSLLADTTPQLGGDLDLNSRNITGTGNINITGTITASGNINLGDGADGDIIHIGGEVSGNLVPESTDTWHLGSAANQWREGWIGQLNVENQLTVGRIMGDLIADDSTVVFDSSTGLVAAAQLTGTATINVTGNVTGNLTGEITATGTFDGDMTGSVFGDNSAIIVDGVNNTLTGDLFGNVTGNAAGDHTGTFVGSGTFDGDLTGSVFADDSTIMIDGPFGKIVGRIESPSIITSSQITVNSEAGQNTGINVVGVTEGTIGTKLLISSSRGSISAPTVSVGGTDGDGLADLQGSGYDGTDYSIAGLIRVAVDLDSTVGTGTVPGRINFITANTSGSLVNLLTFNSAGNLGIGLPRPLQKLHVNGNAKVEGFVQFGSLTTTERNALAAANGMVIYNSTDNKFQGRENGAWVNLV